MHSGLYTLNIGWHAGPMEKLKGMNAIRNKIGACETIQEDDVFGHEKESGGVREVHVILSSLNWMSKPLCFNIIMKANCHVATTWTHL